MAELDRWTRRERDIIRLIGREKLTSPQVAERLGLSIHTVYNYTQQVAAEIPGETKPRYRIMLYVDELDDEQRAAL